MPEDAKIVNIFDVSRVDEKTVRLGACKYNMSRDEAANLAAHLVVAAGIDHDAFSDLVELASDKQLPKPPEESLSE